MLTSAPRNDWAVLKIFRDEGESAKTADRPAFQEMLAFCKAKQNAVHFVVVHDLSRFSRDMGDQACVIAELESAGVHCVPSWKTWMKPPPASSCGIIFGAVNQFDNDRKAERTKLGMKRAASMGRFPFKAPLGYLNVSSQNGANLIPDAERAPLIRKAFELYGTGTEAKAKVLATGHLAWAKDSARMQPHAADLREDAAQPDLLRLDRYPKLERPRAGQLRSSGKRRTVPAGAGHLGWQEALRRCAPAQ